MEIFQSTILGIIQGLGEFLPISSTAHLILAPYFFGWQDPGLSFDVALHIGTLIAVIGFFWKDWLEIFSVASNNIFHTNFKLKINETKNYSASLLWLLVIASVPGAIFGFLLETQAEQAFRHPLIIAFTLSIVGLILYLVDRYAIHKKDIQNTSFKDAIIIGLSQAVAIIPGVSRSGATMTAALACGLSREQAARFSFLLSTPIIFGAAIFKIPELFKTGINVPILLGILAAAVSGYLAIKYMLCFIQKVGYAPFFWYRLVLAMIVIMVYFTK
ncbi:MAG TPA: undecaprenyl-diphosphate phosphatase [Candidatus Moranbacteria bacterium]|nr:undecaprenyl-diphosphate phosphatase [Candidatus Moranbacteria bacterium]HRZ33936.1 undecaprenyl-diphosphate phosphatase [Candidatus Moranbacteria bacterium]